MFSIIIPLYNKSKYILRTIESVFQQSFQDWEIIVVDDGSTDDGYQKVSNLISEKITLLQKENSGVSASRNLGISKARFPYIAFLDADDCWHPDYLLSMKKGTEIFPNAGIWASSFSKDPDELKILDRSFEIIKNYFQIALKNTLFFTSSVVMDKKFFKENEGFNTNLKRGEDLDVWYRAICIFGALVFCPDKLAFYERGDLQGATRTTSPLKASILSIILNGDYIKPNLVSPSQKEEFDAFRDKYVYYHLYKYLHNPENNKTIEETLSRIKSKIPMIDLAYRMPSSLQIWVLKSKRGNRFINKYINYWLDKSIKTDKSKLIINF